MRIKGPVSRALLSTAIAMLAATQGALAADPPSVVDGASSGRIEVALSDSECSALASLGHRSVDQLRASGGCMIHLRLITSVKTATIRLAAEPASARGPVAAAAAAACTPAYYYHNATVSVWAQSFPAGIAWSETATAGFDIDNCNRIRWLWVTCSGHALGYNIRVTWCGAYPSRNVWYQITNTNEGTNFTVSALVDGFPLSWQHGCRTSFDVNSWRSIGVQVW